MADTSIVTPNIGVGTNSLASALITPGYPMAAVAKSSPLSGQVPPVVVAAPLVGEPGVSVRRDASLAQVGEQAKRTV